MTTLLRARAHRGRHAHRTWPAIAALVLLAVVSPFAALCVGDGHAAVEAMLAPHHLASGADHVSAPGARSEATSHGPCVDGLLESAIRDCSDAPPVLDAGVVNLTGAGGRSETSAPGLTVDRWGRVALEPLTPPAGSLRSTVLRI
jgi:hypothetical protein